MRQTFETASEVGRAKNLEQDNGTKLDAKNSDVNDLEPKSESQRKERQKWYKNNFNPRDTSLVKRGDKCWAKWHKSGKHGIGKWYSVTMVRLEI